MQFSAKLLLLTGVVFAIAIAAILLRPPGRQATRDIDRITNELCIVSPATPYDSASGLPMLAPKSIPVGARCPVCGMYPARYPRWAAQAVFKDGASHFFDSPVDLFVFLHGIDRYNRRYTLADVAVSYVTDLETGQWIEASKAFFVHGSSASGPMRGPDLPAFASRNAADAFTRNRGGRMLIFSQVTPGVLASLHRNVHDHH